ncbi:TerB N-terminal domain-containing protein [Paenibacillus agricola]|uniref:TerB-C domain-containing protein n=1 Tax=Paenibacillus agricola TaxID=2716264 RepID=A0ABX0JK15_9BACL|nr:TerB N-terminal domain-containing protein [Paenibacillus agricola]NHN35457.1 hypothetical protein [Paenibacillus agricola]
MTKSTDTLIYRVLSKIKARLRLSLFSSEDYLNQDAVKWTHLTLLGLQDRTHQRYAIFDPLEYSNELPAPYWMSVDNRMKSNPIQFTDYDLDEESPGVHIPQRDPSAQSTTDSLSFNINSRGRSFVDEAKRRAQVEGQPVPFVPFNSYGPTYNDMTQPQLNWYYYWRSEVRSNRYPETDLSYIYVYVFELINGIGWTRPESGYKLFNKISIAYGNQYAQLNEYLIDWISDFVLIHSLNIPLISILTRSQSLLSGELINVELMRLLKEKPSQISLDMLLHLSDYDMQRNKFYQDFGKLDLEFYVPRVVALVDAYLFKTYGLKLIEMFPPQELVTERQLFRSAIYDDTLYGKTISVPTVQLLNHGPLRGYLTQVFKYTENKLRDLRKFKIRLRGITLDQELERLIDRYLDNEFSQKVNVLPKITIDAEKLAVLQNDTEHVRSLLTIAEQEFNQESDSTNVDIPDVPLVVAKQPEIVLQNDRSSKISWDTSNLNEEWSLFASSLDSCQLEALYALKSPAPESELNAVANAYGTMPALIIDDINNVAMEAIGDLIIDGERIFEEYLNNLDNLKG